jgi:mRNA-degrading endonuclease RelE of RelBE toxin-antitoxin system
MGGAVMRAYGLTYAAICRRQMLRLPPLLRPLVKRAIEQFAKEPYAGKRLERELSGYLSIRAKRYRVIYRIDENARTVEIHYLGHRKDIYEVFADEIRQRQRRS